MKYLAIIFFSVFSLQVAEAQVSGDKVNVISITDNKDGTITIIYNKDGSIETIVIKDKSCDYKYGMTSIVQTNNNITLQPNSKCQ